MKLQDLNLKEFLDKTRGKDPVPGGGSISALCGALAASLGEMVTGLTIGRKKYADVEEEMKRLAEIFDKARVVLIDAIDHDAEAYDMVFAAFKMPKETDEEKAARSAKIQETTLYAAKVPLSVAKLAVKMMEPISIVAAKGNQNAITDSCVAMMCARTAALGAILNVRINISSLTDKKIADELAAECDLLQQTAIQSEQNLLEAVNL